MTNTKSTEAQTKAREDRMMKVAIARLNEARKAQVAKQGWTPGDPRTRWI